MTLPLVISHAPAALLLQLLEKKLDDELSHVRQLSDEKARVEKERATLEQQRLTLEAQKSHAELEKVGGGWGGFGMRR